MSADLAAVLWDLRAVHVNFESPFVLPHAEPSPLFVDVRKTFFDFAIRRQFVEALRRLVEREVDSSNVDAFAGDETAGIPLAAWLADMTGKRFVYVRKRNNTHGLQQLIEGGDLAGQRVAFVTDLVNIGATLVPGLTALHEARASVCGVYSIVSRAPLLDYQPYAHLGISLSSLVPIREIVSRGVTLGHISPDVGTRLFDSIEHAKTINAYFTS